MVSLELVQQRHNALWAKQPIVRERLLRRLLKGQAKLDADAQIVVDRVATHICARHLDLPQTMPAVIVAVESGNTRWVPYIAAVERDLNRKNEGGRPRQNEDVLVLTQIIQECGALPSWKDVSSIFEQRTGKQKSPEACRSAIRRCKSRSERESTGYDH
jgi:hypothetical protein